MWLLLTACLEDPSLPVDSLEQEHSTLEETATDSVLGLAPRINEVQSSNKETLVLDDGSTPDWVELYNPHGESVDLQGLQLSDGSSEQALSGTMAPGAFLVVPLDFGLSSEGEELHLSGTSLALPALRRDHSYGIEQEVLTRVLVASDATGTFSLEAAEGWEQADFDDSDWASVQQGVGFDGLDETVEPTDAAAGRPTDQSSDGWGRTGPEAVDGNTATFTHTDTSDFAPWWRVDLGEGLRVHEVLLTNRLDCCRERLYNITVEGLGEDDEVLWASEQLNPTQASPSDPGDLTVRLDSPAPARHVRVRKEAVGGSYESEWLTLAEVVVLASPGSELTAHIGTRLDSAPPEGWLRLPFAFSGEAPQRLLLEVHADDSAEVWLNGALVEPGALDPSLLVEGDNLLALHGTNADEDFLLQATLWAEDLKDGELAFFHQATPGEPNGLGFGGYVDALEVDPPRGFYEQPMTVSVSTGTPGATVVVTTDGSEPTLDHGEQGLESLQIAVETTSILRVAAFAEGLEPTSATHSYLYLEDVVLQPSLPEGLPSVWAGQGQSAVAGDYEMDPEVVDASYDELLAGLRDIPTLSIVLPFEDLFGDEEGLYIHSTQRGSDWEKTASLELITPDGETGFATTAGIRIHGYGWRPHSNTRKHSIRLEFTSEVGPSKLEYPLFGERAPVDRFDSIVLRAQGSRSWQDFRDPAQAQYLRDTFARDTAYDMGKQEGHAGYVHLYLNGLYWGLYNPVERPEADFGAERFGGEPEDYDAINRRTTTNEAIDGTLDAYLELLALADTDLSTDEGYAAVRAMLDVEDLVDYMLIHQYTANRDGPELYSSNNMRGLRHRDGGLWRWFVWDMEYSLWYATDDINVDVDIAGSISHVYARLRQNGDFRALYAERAQLHLTGVGALTPERCAARYDARAEEIERAILGESARWGDTDRATPYTRDVEWAEERRRLMEEFFPARTEVLIQQLTAAGLY